MSTAFASTTARLLRSLSGGQRWLCWVAALLLLSACGGGGSENPSLDTSPVSARQSVLPASTAGYTTQSLTHPNRVDVFNSQGTRVATFTQGSYSVRLSGPTRSFSEMTTLDPTVRSVTHSDWVRVLSQPFNGTVDFSWLDQALQANQQNQPDILALALEYIDSTPAIFNGNTQIAGDAHYGPLLADGTREEGSDFYDYLGLAWAFPDATRSPDSDQFLSLDCSGFIRMVWGYRSGLPLSFLIQPGNVSIPRRSFEILSDAPGVILNPNTGKQLTDFSKLQPGDLVFFDASTNDGTQIDHVGMYLGVDSVGNYRFISSRKSIDGPTLGDYKGKSILNGTGLYATSFRAVRRL